LWPFWRLASAFDHYWCMVGKERLSHDDMVSLLRNMNLRRKDATAVLRVRDMLTHTRHTRI